MADYLKHAKPLERVGIAGLILIIISLIFLFSMKTTAYSVYIDGEEKFAVKHFGDIAPAIEQVTQQQEKESKLQLKAISDIRWERNLVDKNAVVEKTQLEKELKKSIKFATLGVEIQVEEKAVACVSNMKLAKQLLNELKNEYSVVEEGEKLLRVSFAEDVDLIEKEVPVNKVFSKEEAYNLIKIGTDKPEKYIVCEGDNLWSIARKHDMYVDDIMRTNNLKNENLQLEQELILVTSKPYINVVAQVEGEKVETIPYETKTEIDKNSTSSVRIKQAGIDGEKKINYVATKVNGVLEKQDIKEETILKKAVAKIVVKGTKVQVASRGGGSGALDWPAYGPITSYYGSRSGGHTGLDIGAGSGTAIKAADSGTVTQACYQGGYGKMIVINHGNGIVTRYAHCSAINVSVGENVSKGTVIGKVGSTGNSTGPHLHFEVLVNGSFKNPLSYLR